MAVSSNPKVDDKRKPFVARGLLRTYLKLYCDRSTVHGVRYLFNDDLNKLERLCWTAIVVVSISATIITFLILSQRYNDQLLLTFVDESQYPVFNVFFPAVAVCNQKRINWNKFEEAKSLFLPRNATNDTHAIFYEFVKRMESLRFGEFSRFDNMEDIDLEKLDFINVTELAYYLSFRCEDMFDGYCLWRRENFTCCDIFVMEKTEVGFCLVFNSAISGNSRKKLTEDPLYPWRNSKSGEDSGLDITLKLNASSNETDVDDGVFLMIKKSEQWTDVVYSIKGNTDTLVVIRPELTGTDLNTREIPAEIRGCMFDKEINHPLYKTMEGLKYWQWNCFNVCHEEHLLQYCNCTLSMFFPYNATYRECEPADFRCMYKFRDIFSFDKRMNEEAFVKNIRGGMLCPCLISCDGVDYFVTVSTLPIVKREENGSNIMTIDVHYQSEVMLKYRTSREFTYLELIASFGGIIGLFLGASIVSSIEIIYHLTFGLYIFLKDNNIFDRILDPGRKSCKSRCHKRISSANPSASLSPIRKAAWHTSTNRRRY